MLVDELRRRDLLLSSLALGALTACGGAAGGPAPAGATRRVTDPTGRVVDIPADPQRIVALDPNRVITDLVAVGLVPVGATTNATNAGGGFAPVLGAAVDGMTDVGVTGSADLERVVALDPDLIFYASNYQEISVDTLAAIAPVVAYPAAPPGLLAPLRWIGELTGRTAQATEAEDRFHALLLARRVEIGLTGRRVATANLGNYESTPTIGLLGAESGVGELMTLLGATVVPTAVGGAPLPADYADIALELVPEALAEAEVVVALRYGGSAETERLFTERVADPLWRAVPAVARGDVVYLDIQQANGNTGIAGVQLALDSLVQQRSGTGAG